MRDYWAERTVPRTPFDNGVAVRQRLDSLERGDADMAALLLSEAIGGQLFLGFIAAVARQG